MRTRAGIRPGLRVVVVLGLLAVWLGFLSTLAWRTRFGHSDNANAVLAGHAMVQGNVLLSGWTLPADTYWSIELPVFGLFTALAGVGPAAIHGVPVLLGAAVILVSALVAGKGRRARGSWVAAAVVFFLLGLPHHLLTIFFLQGPQHLGTTLFCLIAVLLLRSPPATRRWWLGVTFLGAAVLGDPFALAIGVAPVVVAGLLAAIRRRRWEPALACGAAGIVAVAGAVMARLALDAAGGHRVAPPLPLSPSWNWTNNVRTLGRLFGSLLGAGPDAGLAGLFRHGHAIGMAAVVAAVLATGVLVLIGLARPRPSGETLSRWDAGPSWLDDVVLLAFGGGLAAHVLITLPENTMDVSSARYLLPSLTYGAILAGRRIGDCAQRLPRRAAPLAGAALLAVGSLYLAASVSGMRGPRPADPDDHLVRWLATNDLAAGFGQYWSASVMTVKSRGDITVRPVAAVGGRLHGKLYYASTDWFRAEGEAPRRFLVYEPANPLDGVDDGSAEATFGPPARTAQVGPYRVLIWDQDLTGRLGPPF